MYKRLPEGISDNSHGLSAVPVSQSNGWTFPAIREQSEKHRQRPLRVSRILHNTVAAPVAFPQVKVVTVTAGWTKLLHRERVIHLSPGDVAVLPSRALVGGEPLPIAETVTLYLDPSFIEQQLAWTQLSPPARAALQAAISGTGSIITLRLSEDERRVLTMEARMLAIRTVSTREIGLSFLSACFCFLARLENAAVLDSASLPVNEVRIVVSALSADVARQWRVAELSRMVNLSASQLTRLFVASLGLSPIRVLARLRVERLAELLLTTNWTVKRCAKSVGWSDPWHASQAMKRFYGVTPSSYRDKSRYRSDP